MSEHLHTRRKRSARMGRGDLLRTRLHGALLSAKRRSGGGGVDGLYPYYAGYSSAFAKAVLEAAALPETATVLDPWNGSGTTTHVAQSLGLNAIGLDLNPVAGVIASAKLSSLSAEEVSKHIEALACTPVEASHDLDPLLEWFPRTVVDTFRSLQTNILRSRSDTVPDPGAAFYLCALVRALKSLPALAASSKDRRPNPTWTVQGYRQDLSGEHLARSYAQLLRSLLVSLPSAMPRRGTVSLRIEDARKASSVASGSVDLVLSSPPYLTRIDYAMTTRLELAALGIGREDAAFGGLRSSLMGTTTVRNRSLPCVPESWPLSVRNLLRRIRDHASYSSGSYYYKNIWQYFDDAQQAVTQIHRVLRRRGVAVLVVQTSYYKEVEIDLPHLLADIGNNLGLRCDVPVRVPVAKVMTNLNTRSRRHLQARAYSEALVLMERL